MCAHPRFTHIALIAAALSACSSPSALPSAGLDCGPELRLSPGDQTIRIGASYRVVVSGTSTGLACETPINSAYTWFTDDPKLVRVDSDSDTSAVVTGLATGSTEVRARTVKIRPGQVYADHAEGRVTVTSQ